MRQNSGKQNLNHGYYNRAVLIEGLSRSGLSPRDIERKSREMAKKSGVQSVSRDTVMRALDGDCRTLPRLWVIAKIIGVPWPSLFSDLSSEIHRLDSVGEPSSGR